MAVSPPVRMIKLTRKLSSSVLVHPDRVERRLQGKNREGTGRRLSVILNGLPILAPDLFAKFVCGKNRIKNKGEQKYPASGRKDREHPDTSPVHALSVFPPSPRPADGQTARLVGE